MDRGGSCKDASDLLVKRQRDSPGMKSGIDASDADKNNHSFLEDGHANAAMVQGSSVPVKISLRPIKIPDIKRLSPYTTWVFLDRYVDINIARVLERILLETQALAMYLNISIALTMMQESKNDRRPVCSGSKENLL